MGLFTMPRLGADMERGTLLEWRVAPGDEVRKGDIVALIDTEKSTVDIEVFETGTIAELLVDPGTEVEVGTPLARIVSDTAATGEGSPVAPPDGSPAPAPLPATSLATSPSPAPAIAEDLGSTLPDATSLPVSRVTSPLVRHRAEELHVDTSRVVGSGPGHRITRSDVELAADSSRPGRGSSPKARRLADQLGIDIATIAGSGPGGAARLRDLPPVGEPDRPGRSTPAAAPDRRAASMRSAIARQMTISNREIPHYHLTTTIDLHDAIAWLADHNAGRPAADRTLPAALFISAAARAMVEQPTLNGSWVDDGFVAADGVHAAMAVSLRGGGLIAPVIHDADQLGLDDVMRSLRDLVSRARHGGLRGSDLSGAGFTVTDLGEHGADAVFGVIHPPQVALLGIGGIVDRPRAVDGMLAVRPTVTVTLTADHRASDGHVGSRYLLAFRRLLEHPELLEHPARTEDR